jgi:signal transduction histidine kinase
MLRTKELSGENQKICADYIYSEGRRLEGLSMRMLELTVVKNRQLHYVQTDIEQMIQEIRQMVFLQLKNEGIQIITEVEQALIWMEPKIMKTVFINLIDNARKAINGGGTIWIWGKKVIDGYQIVIRDDGQGMNAEELDRIIKPFYMVDKSRARSQGGAGLGLAICEEILALHGFEMKFESKEEVGTKVAVFMKGETDEKVEE